MVCVLVHVYFNVLPLPHQTPSRPPQDNTVVELTYNYGKTEYSKGNAYAQVTPVLH